MWSFALDLYLLIGVIVLIAATLDPKSLKAIWDEHTEGLSMPRQVIAAVLVPVLIVLAYPWIIAYVYRTVKKENKA